MRVTLFLSSLAASAGLACAAASQALAFPEPDLPAVPRVKVEPNQRVLALIVKGDPDRNGDSAMQVLFQQFFRGAGENEKNAPVRPRVRWMLRAPSVPRPAWLAVYALPVSADFPSASEGPAIVQTWSYGLVAEWGYAGPYAMAQPAIDSLKDFITGNGFVLIGELEEEFLRGHGTLYQGHPETYRTLIRYRVHEIGDWRGQAVPLSQNP